MVRLKYRYDGRSHANDSGQGTMIRLNAIPYVSRGGKDLLLDVVYAEDAGEALRPAIVYVHGGGWLGGDRMTTSNDWLAEAGFFCVSIDYRLTDVAPFPAQIHDVKAAIRWIRKNAAAYGIDPDRIGIWGSSAGGHLSALCAVTTDDPWYDGEGNDGFSSAIQAAVPICPPTDFLIDWYAVGSMPIHPEAEECMRGLLGGSIEDKPEHAQAASPLWQVRADAAPQMIFHGAVDDLVPVGQARAFAAGLMHLGADIGYVEYPLEAHSVDAGIFTENPDPHNLRDQITAFFREQLM